MATWMDEPQIHYAKLKKPLTKDHIMYDLIYVRCPEKTNLQRHKVS